MTNRKQSGIQTNCCSQFKVQVLWNLFKHWIYFIFWRQINSLILAMRQTFVTLVSNVGEAEKPKAWQTIIEIDLLLLSAFTRCWCIWSFSSTSKFMTVDQWIYNCRQKCAVMSKCIRYRPPPQSISAEWNIDHTASTHCAHKTWPPAAVWCSVSRVILITAILSSQSINLWLLYRCSLYRPLIIS